MAIEHLSNRPTRRFLPADEPVQRDRNGFLHFFQEGASVDALLTKQVVLAVAPPWTGKTFVSKQLSEYAKQGGGDESKSSQFGYVHRTGFELHVASNSLPTWWQSWRQSEARACWIIDGVDEDIRNRGEGIKIILAELEGISEHERKRLCVFLFVRENEVPKILEDTVAQIYGPPSDEGGSHFARVRLAPLDGASARQLLVTDDAFNHVCRLIADNRLQSLAGLPAVVQRLKTYPTNEKLDVTRVWRDILLDLVHEKKLDRLTQNHQSSDELQFEAAARLGVILSVSDCDYVQDQSGRGSGLSVDSLIPADHPTTKALNDAGKEVLNSPIFKRGLEGFAFAQHHVQQWLTAFGLAKLSLTKVRPLLTDNTGKPLQHHQGIIGLLYRTTEDRDVKAWIADHHGGVPPRSDAAPWVLSEAVEALDKLQQIAKSTDWRLYSPLDLTLGDLRCEGIGAELVRRLQATDVSMNERVLLLDAAIAVDANEVVAPATEIVLNSSLPGMLREHAATAIIVLGDDAQCKALLSKLPRDVDSKEKALSIRSGLTERLFENDALSFTEAVTEVPDENTRSSMLYYRLQNKMTAGDARTFLASVDLKKVFSLLEKREDTHRGLGALATHAVELLAEQESLATEDYDVLHRLAVLGYNEEDRSGLLSKAITLIARNRDARQKLLKELIDKSEPGTTSFPGRLWDLTPVEDMEWLLEFAIQDGPRHPWYWRHLLTLAAFREVQHPVAARLRENAIRLFPEMVKSVDEAKAERQRIDEEMKADNARRQERQKTKSYLIADLVDSALSHQGTLCERMRYLSRVCFYDEDRKPTNVVGDWGSLSLERREKVLDLCQEALLSCTPTEIPVGNSYTSWNAEEATCFSKIIEYRQTTYRLSGEEIKKWLPSVVAGWGRDRGVIEKCFAVDPKATESVLIAELHRSSQGEQPMVHWVDSLAPELWTDGFCLEMAKVASDPTVALGGRSTILRKLLVQAESVAKQVLLQWLASSKTEERLIAVDLLVLRDPAAVWDEFRQQIDAGGASAFMKIGSLAGEHHNIPTAMKSWEPERIEELYDKLQGAFPSKTDPVREPGIAYGYGRDDAYRDVRAGLPTVLWERKAAGDIAALDRLATKHQEIDVWLKRMRAKESAGKVLAGTNASAVTPKMISAPAEKVTRLLDVSYYRLVRTSEDLQSVLIEELEEISKDSKNYLSCLYYPRKVKKSSLHEEALQAYIYCRLNDRLIGRVLEPATTVIPTREPLTTKNQRLDIRVDAVTVDGRAVTVVIELKWSTNASVSSSLAKQLGKEYLVGAGLTHGIYLVGWNGSMRWPGKRLPRRSDKKKIDGWHRVFRSQAASFCNKNKGVSILPLLMDLMWDEAEKPKTKNKRKLPGKKLKAKLRGRKTLKSWRGVR